MKTAILIDGSNTYMATRNVFEIDWKIFRKYYSKVFGPCTIFRYYSAILTVDGHSELRPLIDWLDYNGYVVIQKPTKNFINAETGITKIKGDMDVEMVVDMLKLAGKIDHIILYTGDGDFVPAVHAVQSCGVFVTVVSAMTVAADELRRAADEYIDLAEMRMEIGRARST